VRLATLLSAWYLRSSFSTSEMDRVSHHKLVCAQSFFRCQTYARSLFQQPLKMGRTELLKCCQSDGQAGSSILPSVQRILRRSSAPLSFQRKSIPSCLANEKVPPPGDTIGPWASCTEGSYRGAVSDGRGTHVEHFTRDGKCAHSRRLQTQGPKGKF